MNNSLCHMRQQIHDLQGCLLAGPEAIPKELLPTACSLQEEHVPVSWIHPNCQPSTHSLVSWLEGGFSLSSGADILMKILFSCLESLRRNNLIRSNLNIGWESRNFEIFELLRY